jgi:class 3 adenylate cyclase
MDDSVDLSREELQLLLQIAGELATQTDQDKLVHTILEKACAMTGSPDGSVLLYDPEHQGLYFAAAVGTKGPELMQKWGVQSSQRVPLESNAGKAFTSGEINLESKARQDDSHYKGVDQQTGKQSRAIVSVPLRIGDRSVGVLQVLNKAASADSSATYDAHDGALLTHLGRLAATAINNTSLVRKLTAQMGLYSRELAEDLVQRLDQPATRESMTLIFADLRGFTPLCQALAAEPGRTQEIMNDLFTMYADRVLSRGGIVNKFVGDAVFALFRGPDGSKRAVRCAFDMLERFDSLRRRWVESCNEDLSFLDLGIGISTGTVALGTFGTGMVRDFTAIGTVVNLASALEFAARGGRRVLVDNATYQGAQDIVEEYAGPTPFEIVKAGQPVIGKYRHFHLERLKADRPVRVFISHNHRDREFVEAAITEPLAKHGIETWYSNSDIIPGEKYIQRIEDGLLKCDWVAVLITENSVQSGDWVRAEVNAAMSDPRFRDRVVPLKRGEAMPAQISHELGLLNALDLSSVSDAGEVLYEFLTKRETELRMAAKSQ